MRFPTKVDAWLVTVIGLAIALSLAVGVAVVREERATGAGWIALTITVATIAGTAAVALPTFYVLAGGHLVARSGLLRWNIPLASIESIEPTRNPLSGPAWSLDRLEVRYREGTRARSILISPRHADLFVQEVARLDTGLVRTGRGLSRRVQGG